MPRYVQGKQTYYDYRKIVCEYTLVVSGIIYWKLQVYEIKSAVQYILSVSLDIVYVVVLSRLS